MSAVLTLLRIKNLALVEELAWQMGPGFIAVTGETGAGKSIIIGALQLLLGERADKSLIRTGAAGASLTGSTALRFFAMPKALDEIAKEAMDLPARQRLALAEFLPESAEAAADPEAEAGWKSEIRDPIRAIDEDRVVVMREAEKRLSP